MVCYALRVFAFCDSYDFLRHHEALLLDNLEVADYIDCGLRRDQCEFVELFVLEEFIGNLDDALLAIDLAGKIDSYGNLAFYTFLHLSG